MVALAVLAAVALPTPAALADARPVDDPTVTVPTQEGLTGHPFAAAPSDLLPPYDYVEQELFVEGTATGYDASPTALVPVGAATPLSPAPYRTRIVVRHPADPAEFNGTVVMEWLNVTSGYDVDSEWAHLHPELLRSGYAYVAVTAQLVGRTGLGAYDPVRYASLLHPGDPYSYDIFAQVAKAIRAPVGLAPLGALAVDRVLATGSSQSAAALDTFVNVVRPGVERVIDGYLIVVGGSDVPDDLDVPVLRVLSEGEVDGSEPSVHPLYRQWEIAGGSHADIHHGRYWARTQDRDWGTPAGTWPLTPRDTPTCQIGSLPRMYAGRAALDALTRWVADGTVPPAVDRIDTRDGAIVRDEHGNTLGGVRLPAIDVPTATYTGDGFGCGPTLGKTEPFSPATLDQLYPTHAGYVAAVTDAAAGAVARGVLLPADEGEIVALADASDVGAD